MMIRQPIGTSDTGHGSPTVPVASAPAPPFAIERTNAVGTAAQASPRTTLKTRDERAYGNCGNSTGSSLGWQTAHHKASATTSALCAPLSS